MIYLGRFCCICLDKGKKLEKLSSTQQNSLSYYDKLSSLIPQIVIDEIKEMVNICEQCKVYIDNVYNFRNTCLNNNKLLWKYISQLCLDKKCVLVDSIVLNKVKETLGHDVSNVNSLKLDDYEGIHTKTEFESLDDHIPVNELNTEQSLVNNKLLNINLKPKIEISDDYLHESNSVINNLEDTVYENKEIKNNDLLIPEINIDGRNKNEAVSLLHTEINIDCKKEVSNDEDEIQNYRLKNILDNYHTKSITEDDRISIKNEININTGISPKNDPYLNYLKNNSFHPGVDREDNKICYESVTSNSNNNQKNPGEKLYKCEMCNKTFNRKSSLKTHNRIHTGEKPYKCEICNKSFTDSSNFNRHNKSHSAEKPYKCEICHEYFTGSSDLKRHGRIHTGEKSYKCDVCNKLFTRPEQLKIHIRIHTGEKPYQCKICTKSFTDGSNFNRHIKTHIGDKTMDNNFVDLHFLCRATYYN